ncbi:hypothetical protein ANN_14251 [Periplaneta americana]|uniref:Uncharacterized protein n=1 Tax=Periplaneta americana TaxID=6978 RepID=A0ABQ8SVT4_PERAM|nr:hypothetical protein ANN_14251 [Periplaneta americana]
MKTKTLFSESAEYLILCSLVLRSHTENRSEIVHYDIKQYGSILTHRYQLRVKMATAVSLVSALLNRMHYEVVSYMTLKYIHIILHLFSLPLLSQRLHSVVEIEKKSNFRKFYREKESLWCYRSDGSSNDGHLQRQSWKHYRIRSKGLYHVNFDSTTAEASQDLKLGSERKQAYHSLKPPAWLSRLRRLSAGLKLRSGSILAWTDYLSNIVNSSVKRHHYKNNSYSEMRGNLYVFTKHFTTHGYCNNSTKCGLHSLPSPPPLLYSVTRDMSFRGIADSRVYLLLFHIFRHLLPFRRNKSKLPVGHKTSLRFLDSRLDDKSFSTE